MKTHTDQNEIHRTIFRADLSFNTSH